MHVHSAPIGGRGDLPRRAARVGGDSAGLPAASSADRGRTASSTSRRLDARGAGLEGSARLGVWSRRACSTRSSRSGRTQACQDELHMERFAIARTDKGGEGGTVTFAISDKTVDIDGATSLLEAGEKVGIQMPFGCRMGICQTCVLPLESGHVRDFRSGNEHGAGRPHQHLHLHRIRRLHTEDLGGRSMAITDIKQYAHLTAEDVEEPGARTRRDPRRHRGIPRRARRPLHPARHPAAAWTCRRRPNRLVRQPQQGRLDRRHRRCSRWRRSSRTWNSVTTSPTVSGTG